MSSVQSMAILRRLNGEYKFFSHTIMERERERGIERERERNNICIRRYIICNRYNIILSQKKTERER